MPRLLRERTSLSRAQVAELAGLATQLEEKMGRPVGRARENVGAAMARLGEMWSAESLPEIQRYLNDWDNFDLRGASIPQVLAHLDETLARFKRLWEIHLLLAFPMPMSVSTFEESYRDLFGSEGAFDALRLLQGPDNRTVETDASPTTSGGTRRPFSAPSL